MYWYMPAILLWKALEIMNYNIYYLIENINAFSLGIVNFASILY